MTGKVNRVSLSRRANVKAKNREQYLKNIQKTLWQGREMPNLPITAVTDLATELFTSSCGARKLAGLHLSDAVQASCKGRVSPCSLVLALLYLERLKTGGDIAMEYLSDITPSELFFVSMLVANKFLQDEGDTSEVENWFWSDLSGFDVDHINGLEKKFLSVIKWEVYVSETEFWQRIKGLHRTVSYREGLRRGWFSYEETSVLLDLLSLSSMLQTIMQVSVVCIVSYSAAFMTLFGAAVISVHLQQCLMLSTMTTNLTLPPSTVIQAPLTLNPCPLSIPDFWQYPSVHDNISIKLPVFLNNSPPDNLLLESTTHELDMTWHHLISYLTPATSQNWLMQEARKEVALLQLKQII